MCACNYAKFLICLWNEYLFVSVPIFQLSLEFGNQLVETNIDFLIVLDEWVLRIKRC